MSLKQNNVLRLFCSSFASVLFQGFTSIIIKFFATFANLKCA